MSPFYRVGNWGTGSICALLSDTQGTLEPDAVLPVMCWLTLQAGIVPALFHPWPSEILMDASDYRVSGCNWEKPLGFWIAFFAFASSNIQSSCLLLLGDSLCPCVPVLMGSWLRSKAPCHTPAKKRMTLGGESQHFLFHWVPRVLL